MDGADGMDGMACHSLPLFTPGRSIVSESIGTQLNANMLHRPSPIEFDHMPNDATFIGSIEFPFETRKGYLLEG
jgi:hypothetical protein